MPERRYGFGEQESQSGTLRGDPAGVRAWGRNDPGGGPEVGSASAGGAKGAEKCAAGGAEDTGAGAAEVGGGDSLYRRDSGKRPQSAAQAAAHGAPYLGANAARDARSGSGRIDGAAICAREEGGDGVGRAGDIHCTVVRVGRGRASGLVRGLGGLRRPGTSDGPGPP